MTILTQLSVGAFANLWIRQLLGRSPRLDLAALAALLVGGLALAASTLHLGRPIHAYRALKMWKRSWLSREVLVFGGFSNVAFLYAALLVLKVPGSVVAGGLTTLLGIAGLTCTARIYMVRPRPAWNSNHTLLEFYFSALLLGILFVRAIGAVSGRWTLIVLVGAAAAQLANQSWKFFRLVRSRSFERQASARLLSTTLAPLVLLPWRSADRRRHVASALCCRERWCNRCTSREPGCRNSWPLPVFRQCGSQEHCAVLPDARNGGGLNLKRQLGLDILSEKYSFGQDPVMGYTSARKMPDRWVATTCGYCSVGCGMFIGVKDGRAVSVRGNPAHPVNRGASSVPRDCPSTTRSTADQPRTLPVAREERQALRAHRLGRSARHDGRERFKEVQKRTAPDAVGVISTGQLVTEEFYTLGKLVQLGLGTTQLRRQYHALHVDRGGRLQAIVWQRRPARRVRGSGEGRRDPADRREHRREPSDPLPAPGSKPEEDAHRGRSARDQDRDDGRSLPADQAPHPISRCSTA